MLCFDIKRQDTKREYHFMSMDLNQSNEFNPFSNTSPQVHNFMPISNSFLFPNFGHQPSPQLDGEEARHARFLQGQKESLGIFWNQQLMEIQNTTAFKSHHQLPLARIKRIMKSDGDVKMISADTPILFSKACELFILELTLRAWLQTENCKRRTLQRCDIARAIRNNDNLDFLVEVVPCDQFQDDEAGKYGEEIQPRPSIEVPVPIIQPRPSIEVPFPMMDINNENMVLANQEIAPQFMINPSMPSTQFNYEPNFQMYNF